MIRILHVVSSLNINAGTMSVIMNYYRHVDRTKIQFDFLYFEEMTKTHQEEIKTLGGRTYLIDSPLYSLDFQVKLYHFLSVNGYKYQAIHCHPIWGVMLIGPVAKMNGIKHVIQHSHSTEYSDNKISAFRNRCVIYAENLFATEYMACSPEAAEILKNGKKPVTILNNAIDLPAYKFDLNLRNAIRTELDVDNETFVVGSIGRLCEQKNQLFMLEIFKELVAFVPNSKLVLVGSGSKKDILVDRISSLALENNVILTGRRSDIRALLSSFDVFLMPSKFEGAPVAAIEAIASGLNCVISDTITKMIASDYVCYMSLDSSPLDWARTTYIKKTSLQRDDQSEIANMGFDISLEADKLLCYYESL